MHNIELKMTTQKLKFELETRLLCYNTVKHPRCRFLRKQLTVFIRRLFSQNVSSQMSDRVPNTWCKIVAKNSLCISHIYNSICLHFEDGIVLLLHVQVNLYTQSSPFYLATAQSQYIMALGRDGVLSTLCHSCGFAYQQRVLKTFPHPVYLYSEDGVV